MPILFGRVALRATFLFFNGCFQRADLDTSAASPVHQEDSGKYAKTSDGYIRIDGFIQ